MKFSLGDKIILKRTGEEGVVTNYISKEMIEVEVNGTHFPVYIDEVDHPYLKWFTEKKQQQKKSLPEQLPVEKEKHRPKRLPKGIYLSFMPVYKADEFEDVVELLKIHLINETAVSVRFSYEVNLLNTTWFQHEGTLHAFGNLYLHSMPYGDMNDQPRFIWRLADSTNPDFREEEGVLRLKPSKLFAHINELLVKNEPTFSYLLVEDFVEKPKTEKKPTQETLPAGKPTRAPKITSLADLPRYELDLHIEQLTDQYKKLSNAEIMDIQLRTLERYVLLAIVHRQERMMIIHGLGTGALRDAVHRYLKTIPEVRYFRNEWHGKYGFGATEVVFNSR